MMSAVKPPAPLGSLALKLMTQAGALSGISKVASAGGIWD
jgi:hypothetical protein